jgi:hypothetical protein
MRVPDPCAPVSKRRPDFSMGETWGLRSVQAESAGQRAGEGVSDLVDREIQERPARTLM